MSKINDGGPAFPVPPDEGQWDQSHYHGMSLRDWFAGEALCGFFANSDLTEVPTDSVATNCYAAADAMLRERAKAVRS